jgi:hypothetical protein
MAGISPVTQRVRKPVSIVNIGLTHALRDDMLLRHPYIPKTKQLLERWITGTV